eukprot:8511812-Alexandrium_andersonii.AAC.1
MLPDAPAVCVIARAIAVFGRSSAFGHGQPDASIGFCPEEPRYMCRPYGRDMNNGTSPLSRLMSRGSWLPSDGRRIPTACASVAAQGCA